MRLSKVFMELLTTSLQKFLEDNMTKSAISGLLVLSFICFFQVTHHSTALLISRLLRLLRRESLRLKEESGTRFSHRPKIYASRCWLMIQIREFQLLKPLIMNGSKKLWTMILPPEKRKSTLPWTTLESSTLATESSKLLLGSWSNILCLKRRLKSLRMLLISLIEMALEHFQRKSSLKDTEWSMVTTLTSLK